MKRFLYRFIVWFVVGCCIVSGYHYAIYGSILSSKEFYTLSDSVDTIVIGDSHTETSISNRYVDSLQNLSYKGESPFLSYYKLKRLLETNSNIEYVVFSFSYYTLNEFQDSRHQSLLSDYYFLLDWHGIKEMDFTPENLRIVLQDVNSRLYRFLISKVRDREYHLLTGGFNRLDADNLSRESSRIRVLGHYFADDEMRTQKSSKLQERSLEKIVQLCVDRGVNLVLLNTPLHRTYFSGIPEKYIVSYSALADSIGQRYPESVTHFDLKDAVTADEHFFDGDHLNGVGGEYFMKTLMEKLESLK